MNGGLLNLVIIGASTGGPRVLPILFSHLPALRACVLIVQHMPAFINPSFAQTLGRYSAMPVRIANNNEPLESGSVFIAPSDLHCSLVRNRIIRLWAGENVNYVCPAVDVTMKSLCAPAPGERLAGVVLTGMGRDGAAGLVHMKSLGGITIAQDKATSPIYGMPAEAVKTGCVSHVLPPDKIAALLGKLFT